MSEEPPRPWGKGRDLGATQGAQERSERRGHLEGKDGMEVSEPRLEVLGTWQVKEGNNVAERRNRIATV